MSLMPDVKKTAATGGVEVGDRRPEAKKTGDVLDKTFRRSTRFLQPESEKSMCSDFSDCL